MARVDDGYFDLSPTDRSMAVIDRTSPVVFHILWDLIGSLDLEALTLAWQVLAGVHPIVACTADIEVDTVWRPGREPTPIRLLEANGDVDQETAGELAMPMDLANGPLVRLSAIARTDGFRLVLAAHHAAFDGMAGIVLIDDLRRIYLDYVSASRPTLEPDMSSRTIGRALRSSGLPLLTRQSVVSNSIDRWRRLPPSTHVDPSTGPSEVATDYFTIEIGPVLAALDERRRRNSWSVDAVLVGLLEAAWTETFGYEGHGAGVWLLAHDLRPRLGVTRGMGNLSGAEPIAIRRPEARPLDRLIEQASAEIAATRAGIPGLGAELMARSWAWMPPSVLNRGAETMIRAGQRQRHTRTFSNMGRLPDSLTDWGRARMEEIRILGPMAKGPYTMFVGFAHGSSSWLTTRIAPDWLSRAQVMELEAAMRRLSNVGPDSHNRTAGTPTSRAQ